MKSQTFKHNSTIYTVRETTIFDEEMFSSLWVDFCIQLAARLKVETKDLPRSIDRLARNYVQWMQVTTIDTPPDEWAAVSVYDIDLAAFDGWRVAILADQQALAVAWSGAYQQVNAVDGSEKKDSSAANNGNSSDSEVTVATT